MAPFHRSLLSAKEYGRRRLPSNRLQYRPLSPRFDAGADGSPGLGKLDAVNGHPSERALELIDASPGVAEALERVDAMTDAELRSLVAGEHPMVVEAADAIIARRHSGDRAVS